MDIQNNDFEGLRKSFCLTILVTRTKKIKHQFRRGYKSSKHSFPLLSAVEDNQTLIDFLLNV